MTHKDVLDDAIDDALEGMMNHIFGDASEQRHNGCERGPTNRPLPEAQIATLKEIAARFQRVNPFSVGDLVSAIPGMHDLPDGPIVVVEVLPEPMRPHGDVHPSQTHFAPRLDMRICVMNDRGDYLFYWVESPCFDVVSTE